MVEVLDLVDQHVREPIAVVGGYVVVLAQQPRRDGDEVAEVERVFLF